MRDPFPYIYDFMTFVFDNPESRKHIKSVILFGSVATGEHDEKSDIDLFVDVISESQISAVEKTMKESEKRFYPSVEKKWAVIGMEMPIRYIVGCLDSYTWKGIKSDIISAGITLYGKYEGVKEGLRHYSMFSYDISKLDNKKKVLILRKLFGYSQRRNSKTYRTEGYLKEIGGMRIGRNCLLVMPEKSRNLQKFFTSFRITPEIREVWVNE